MNNTIRIFDAFAGIGALEKALTNINIPHQVVCMSEIDIDAIISYGAIRGRCKYSNINFMYPSISEMQEYLKYRNIGTDFKTKKNSVDKLKTDKLKQCYKTCKEFNNLGDISIINPMDIPDFDLMNFSFSCQDISIAGKQAGLGDNTRSGLYKYGINIIKHKKPKYIMIENVKGLIQKKFINDFYNIINDIESLGYNCYYPQKDNKPVCLNAKNYNIAQNRERIFVICIRQDIDDKTFQFDFGTPCDCNIKYFLEENVDEKYYINTEKANKLIEILLNENKLDTKEVKFPCDSSINEPKIKKISNCITARYDAGIQNQKSIGLAIMERQPVIIGSTQKHSAVKKDGICSTLTSAMGSGGGHIPMITSVNAINSDTHKTNILTYNYRIRKLTPKECWRLMGFDDKDIDKCVKAGISNSQLYKQAGNSIVVNVLESIFTQLFKLNNNKH